MKIMIVDDNAEMRTYLKNILGGTGAEFVECADGGEAIATFPAAQPDWTLMDLVMKPVNGLTATRAITGQFPESRVLILTQDANPQWRAAASAAGACGFLLKDNLSQLPQMISANAHETTTLYEHKNAPTT